MQTNNRLSAKLTGYKCCINALVVLAGFMLMNNSSAALINVGYDSYNDPYLNVVNPVSGVTNIPSLITDWEFLYEDTTGSGTLSVRSNSTLFGDFVVIQADVSTNDNGSLSLNGSINFIELGESASFYGDMAVTIRYNETDQVTVFDFSPLSIVNSGVAGLQMTDGPMIGDLLDFQVTSSVLAIVDNPFPVYAPVPVPAAIWLFISGLTGLSFLPRRRRLIN